MALSDNLIHYYNFDEASGDLIDQVGTNDGTVTGCTYSDIGKINTAYGFDGNDHIAIDEAGLDGASAFSVSVWIFKHTEASYDTILGAIGDGANKYGYMATNAGKLWFRWVINSTEATAILGATELDTGVWYHVVFWYDGTNTRIYLNGNSTPDAQGTSSGVVTIDGDIWFGANPFSLGINWYDGHIDECGIWTRALTTAEISELYNSGSGLPYPFTIPTNLQLNIADDWKVVDAIKINIGDTWKAVEGMQINIGDSWKVIF